MADEFFASSSQELQARLRGQAEAQLDSVIQSAPDKFSEHLNKLTQEAGLTLVKVTGSEAPEGCAHSPGVVFRNSPQRSRATCW